MTVESAVFTCSICGEPSSDICAFCTKDTCANHRCTRCKRCSDCCECEVPLSENEPEVVAPAEPEPPAGILDPPGPEPEMAVFAPPPEPEP